MEEESITAMNQQQRSHLLHASSRFSPPLGLKFSYGTAGFRADASLLESTVFRMGILAALRSVQTGSTIGLMITASHNKESDNGVKVADPSGGMLSQSWEPFADALSNAPDAQSLVQLIEFFVRKESISLDGVCKAEVLLGRDTRSSGVSLLEAAKEGIASIMGAKATDMGVVTTPQLHWMVRAKNKGIEASEYNYYEQLLTSFRCLLDYIPEGNKSKNAGGKVAVDGADGVGGQKLEKLTSKLNNLTINVRNCGDGVLNEGVGADYVQKEKVVPRGFGPADAGIRCVSLDGDADRLVYFCVSSNSNNIELVDGDKILSLFALYLKEQLGLLVGPQNEKSNSSYQPHLGVVQTAYANGASTDYLKKLGLEVVLTPTGVKYLHEKAAEYDIGIYFEANGHGTILFSDSFLSWLETRNKDLSSTSKGSDQHKATVRLLATSKLINQAVGDALSGFLLVEAILQHMGWTFQKWIELYHDLPSKQLKVKVADRTAISTANAETVVVNPVGLQEAIDSEIAKYSHGRCFVRPSGTEDVVRVYAEASTQEAADNLAHSVVKLVDQYLGASNS
ncbi:phosphoacetylglucosamine mutase [Andrographis paniculata]|uniref:phosphoacetylglucosamine mutase n=1 Tax=Andrographis paniculata TaxID=175694 RepID=UPI0021E97AAA|nr:phosphoacetylglucosamine mutase [Andrographis paniculata]